MKKVWLSAPAVAPVSVGALLIASLVSFGAVGSALAQPSQLKLAGFTYAGSGCPAGSVHVSVSPFMGSAVLRFDSLEAETAGGALDSKSCQAAIRLHADPSWSFAVPKVRYRGSARLSAGAAGTQTSTYRFQGVPQVEDARAQTTLDGPFTGDYSRSDDMGALVWSPCGVSEHTLVIDAEISVSGASGRMSVESAAADMIHAYDIVWKKCP